MRVVLAPSRFAGTLTAREAAEAMARGWSRSAPHDEVVTAPMSDAGVGFLDVVSDALGGDVLAATVADPRGRPVPAAVLVVEDDRRRTAYVEVAQACGPELVSDSDRDLVHFTSTGAGELLELALSTQPTSIVVGIGQTATHDAGAGLLAALGAGRTAALTSGGLALADVRADDLDGLAAVRERFRDVRLVLATRAILPLLGFQGASAVEAETRGATAQQAQALEIAFGRWTQLVSQGLPQPRDLVSGAPRRLDREPGAGAGGGLGYALLLLGARRVDGADLVADLIGLSSLVREADLAVTGEGRFDWRSLRDSVPAVVSARAMAAGIPAVVLAGQVTVGRREAMTAGLSGTYAVCDRPADLARTLADPAGTLEARAARVASTWSPAPESSS